MAVLSSFLLDMQGVLWSISTAGYFPMTFALFLGIIPALIWLWFWLREDQKNPEPRSMIFMAFLAGFGAVLIAIPMQKISAVVLEGADIFTLYLVFAGIEEILKFAWCYFIVLKSRENNEPIDAVIYLITTALGFAALENALFVINPLAEGQIIESVITSNFRFIGASLLHVIASASIGVFWAWSFYKSKDIKIFAVLTGFLIAIVLHTLFNFLIITSEGTNTFFIFSLVWIGVAVLLGLFEKIKKINPKNYVKR